MATIADKFGKASVDTDYAVATTVENDRTAGASVLECFDLSKFSDDTPVFFVTYKKTTDPLTGDVTVTNQVSWKALVNTGANTLTNLTLAPGYTDLGNDVGDFVECIPTSYWGNSLVEGLEVSLDPDGTLKSGAVDNAAVLASNVVTTAKILDDAVTLAKVATAGLTVHYKEHTSAITSGGAGSFTNAGIVVMAGDVVIAKAGVYEVSVLLPSMYAEATTTQWNLRVKSGATTFFDTTTGTAVPPAVIAGVPMHFYWRRRMTLAAATYATTFEWYGAVAGAGNEIFIGAGTDQPATFVVKAV